MKIAIINNLYPPFDKGGAEFIAEQMKNGLSLTHKTLVITTKPYLSKEDKKGIYYINSLYYNLSKLPFILRFFWHFIDIFSFRKYFQIKKILQRERCDVVITHNLKGIGLMSARAIKKTGAKHIHTLHDVQLYYPSGLIMHSQEGKINKPLNKIYIHLTRKIFERVDEVVSPSKWLADEHTKREFFKKAQIHIIPNPINIPPHPGTNKNLNNFKILFAGQIEEHKGVSVLINAYKKIQLRTRGIKLIIAGDGSKKQFYKIRTRDDDSVSFVGKKDRSELNKLIASSDVVVVPSLCYENSPSIVYEAAVTGTPVIASHIGGIPEIIKKIPGETFQPGSEDELVEKMLMIKNGKLKRLNKETQKFEPKNLKTEKYIQRIEKIIRRGKN